MSKAEALHRNLVHKRHKLFCHKIKKGTRNAPTDRLPKMSKTRERRLKKRFAENAHIEGIAQEVRKAFID